MRWVRPILTMPAQASALADSASRRAVTEGMTSWTMASAPAMCIAVGKVSLEDCARLTWSLGCTGDLLPSTPPAISMARLAMTSLAFMLDWVPEPVCQTRNGKWSSSFPSMTSWAAAATKSPTEASSWPRATFVRAAACFRMPKARTTPRGMVSSPMSKLISERAVWQP